MATEQLIVMLCVILLATGIFGLVFHCFGQPRVVGETATGIVLGPSVLGA